MLISRLWGLCTQQVTALMDKVKVSEVPQSLRDLKSPEWTKTTSKRRYSKKGTSAKSSDASTGKKTRKRKPKSE